VCKVFEGTTGREQGEFKMLPMQIESDNFLQSVINVNLEIKAARREAEQDEKPKTFIYVFSNTLCLPQRKPHSFNVISRLRFLNSVAQCTNVEHVEDAKNMVHH
jgi:hypothetical protein